VGLKSKAIEIRDLPPSHLTFLIDVSGSMQDPLKLPLVKRSFALLIEQLRTEDSVAIVVYAGKAGLVLPPTPGSQKFVIQDAIDRLEGGGSTAGGEGIQLAYATARSMYRQDANNRVILATDGDFNVGVSSHDELIRLIENERDHGVYLTVLGFGMGNLKDATLETLADNGNGHYAYVDSILEARRVFVEGLGATLQTVAKDVKFQLDFNPARIKSYRLIGYEKRKLTAEEFRDDRKDAGDLGAGHSVTALYQLIPNGSEPLLADAFTLRLRYKPPEVSHSLEISVEGRAETTAPSADSRFAAAIAQFGMLLRDSADKGESSYDAAIALAQSAIVGDARRGDLLEQLKKASELHK
jgi:Ca-activated chloride channel family protein